MLGNLSSRVTGFVQWSHLSLSELRISGEKERKNISCFAQPPFGITHNGSPVCLLNLIVFGEDQGDEATAAANWAQWEEESGLRQQNLSASLAVRKMRQCEGPLRKVLIPVGHSRRSCHPLWHATLKCRRAAREVDMGSIEDALTAADGGSALDVLPLDLLLEGW